MPAARSCHSGTSVPQKGNTPEGNNLGALFIDFNSYFASVEQQEDRLLRGRPVAVLPVMADTTCCIAASYEAKAFGVKTGTRVWEAKKLCPELITVQARHEVYVHYHQRLVEAVESCAPVTEVRSIDEMWCELTGSWQQPEVALGIARQIKNTIADDVGECLTSSIGLAPNWFLAKIASNMQKPDGLTLIRPSDLPEALYGLELGDIYGIGQRSVARLNRQGIHTVEQLCACNKQELHAVYRSVYGERLHDLLRGKVVFDPPTQRATVSHSHVLPPYLRNEEGAKGVLVRLLQKAAMRLRKMGYTTGEIALSVSYTDKTRWKPHTRLAHTDDTRVLLAALETLWAQKPAAGSHKQPSAVGIVFSQLLPVEQTTADLFEKPGRRALNSTIDELNLRFGKNAVCYGSAWTARDEAPMRIAFTRIPDIQTEA